ncbi:hypothetical protein J7L48_05170, partial [bacterium]|nr:hypothetical protein [bacterium]
MKSLRLILVFSFIMLISLSIFANNYTVINSSDSGGGSLREAITSANSNVGPDTIVFTMTGTIQPTSALPTLSDTTGGTIIFAGLNHDVEIDGSLVSNVSGITISSANNVISGMVINSFGGLLGARPSSITITGAAATGNIITNNYLGTDTSGTIDKGNVYSSIRIVSGASGNTIGGAIAGMGNVISGSFINIVLQNTDGNYILGNKIGTDVNGTSSLGADAVGISLFSSNSNIIGGITDTERNIISGNSGNGVEISNSHDNVVSGNYIGTDINGTSSLGNSGHGVLLTAASYNNTLENNVISGNIQTGVAISGSDGVDYNTIIGNFIGTDKNGTSALGNSYGMIISNGAKSNTIGGTIAGARNIISGNNFSGVYIYGNGTNSNIVLGNYIGTDVNGTADLGNAWHGVYISNVAKSNTIGGTIAGARNIISGNNSHGVLITGTGTDNNVVLGNYIGTDVNGTADLGNSNDGVYITSGAQSNTIGGIVAGARNIISGNNNIGVLVSDSDNNTVLGNYIGTDVTGTIDIANLNGGIVIRGGAQSNTVGGTVAGARNIISGNNTCGVAILSSGTDNNKVLGNYIGTDVNGTSYLGNSAYGIEISNGAQSNTIGGTIAGVRNIISGNNNNGVYITDSGTDNNVVLGNYIGTDVSGTLGLGNSSSGIYIQDGAQSNTIGGTIAGAKNVISGNTNYGVYLGGSGTDNNVILGNYIGTDVTGTVDLGNTWSGIQLFTGSKSTIIGGTIAGARNIISGNNGGINIYGTGTDNNQIRGNYIGTDVSGTADLGNSNYGVYITGNPKFNMVGGTMAGSGNVISGNDEGIIIRGTNSMDNQVFGNYIGTAADGTGNLGNSQNGVYIYGGAHSNTIGGTISGMANIIAFSGWDGVYVADNATDNNRISGNSIFSNTGLGIDLAANGVTPNDAGDNDTGPNENLNFPVITDIVQTGIDTYTINGTAAASIEVELYIVNNSTAGVTADPTGYGEGYEYYTTLITDGSGNFSLPGMNLSSGDIFSSLAIDGSGNTSEFSKNKAISSNTVTISINDDAPVSQMQGAADVLMSNFTLSADADNAIWTNIKVEGNGTNIDTDISSIEIYKDNGNGIFSSAEDTPLGNGIFASGISNIDITDQNITATTSLYFIAIDLNSNGSIGNTFDISISDSSNFSILVPDTMANFSPFTSGSVLITDGPDPITVLPADHAVTTTKAGIKDQLFEKLTFNTLKETATLSVIKTDLIGTGDDNDITDVKIYLDNGDDSFSVADDTLIGT